MKSFFLMLSFFTRLPVPKTEYEETTYKNGIKYLPLVGLLIGLILWGFGALLQLFGLWNLTTVLIVVAYIFLTGGLHLELHPGRPPETPG